MRTITLEEHFATPRFLDGPGQALKEQAAKFEGRARELLAQLCELGDKRIKEMDAAQIDMQILSITSPAPSNWRRPKQPRSLEKQTTT